MSTVDLSSYQSAQQTSTDVVMPEGDTISLRPLMSLGSEHDQLIMDVLTSVSKLPRDTNAVSVDKLGELMPVVGKLLSAASPTKKDASRIDRLPMMARFQVLMGYIQDQDMGGPAPSED